MVFQLQLMMVRYEDVIWEGQQGKSSVFRGRMVFSNEPIALKRFQGTLDDNMRNEIEVLKGLSHTALPRIRDAIMEPNGASILVMDFAEGTSLRQTVTFERPLTLPVARAVSKQLVEAVAFLHFHGVPHRDIKLDNIILIGHTTIKLVDFGTCDKDGNCCDFPDFVRGCVDAFKVDVCYVGIAIYEMFSGTRPGVLPASHGWAEAVCDEGVAELLQCCLPDDPKNIKDASDLLCLPWLTDLHEPVNDGQCPSMPPVVDEDPKKHCMSHFTDPLEGLALNPDDHPILAKYPTPESRIALMERLAVTLKTKYGLTRNDIDFYSYEQMSRHLYWISAGKYPLGYDPSITTSGMPSLSHPAVTICDISSVFPSTPQENMLSLEASHLASETDALLN